ncbi:MAG: hypothetical protein ACYC6W_11070 [Nitrosotalea sp.]
MTYTTTQLITNSYYLSGVVARQLQTISGQQIFDGLNLLNAMLAVKSANVRLIPYFTEYTFNAVIGQEKYFIPNLVAAETITFNIGPIRYPIKPTKRIDYWSTGRIDNITSLPGAWNFQRVLNGANVYLYFLPQQTFPMVLWGKFGLPSVTLGENLETVYDDYYIEYLRYALAEQICIDYNITLQPQAEKRLHEMESIIMQVSPPDLTMQKQSALGTIAAFNYGDVNFGKGWRP